MPETVANYITVDPVTGHVSAEFSGHVVAEGVDLQPDPGVNGFGNSLRWMDPLNADPEQFGMVRLSGFEIRFPDDPTTPGFDESSASWNATWRVEDVDAERANIGGKGTSVQQSVVQGGEASVAVNAHSAAGVNTFRTLITDAGASDYVQLAPPRRGSGALRVNWGVQAVTVPAGQTVSGAAGVAHGLGVVPAIVFTEDLVANFGSFPGAHTHTSLYTASTFQIQTFNQNGYSGGVVVTVGWLAIG